MRERAVSNTLGFIVIFSLVLFSLVLVSTAGLGGLQDTRDATMSLNAEQSMESLGNAIEDVHRENESRRTASMRLGRGTLETGEETEITVTNGTDGFTQTIDPIVYRLDDTKIAYEGSAIVREQEQGARTLRPPSFVLTDDEAIIPVVNTTSAASGSVGGTTAQVRLRRTGSETKVLDVDASEDVEIVVETTVLRAQAWERTLEDLDPSSDICTVSGGGTTVTCTKDVDGTLVTRHVQVEYAFEG